MSDKPNIIKAPINPLDGASFTPRSGVKLVMRPLDSCARFSLRISKEHLAKAAGALKQEIPARIGEISSTGEIKVLCLGPDEWLILAPQGERDIIAACFAQISEQIPHSLVDVSHSNTGIEVSGPVAALALSAGCPLNLDALPIGGCARTILDKAQIVLMRLDEEYYQVETLRSFVEFVWSFLSIAGRSRFNTTCVRARIGRS